MDSIIAIAHRGFSAAAPENTLAAFEKALELGPEMIECDIRRSADGRLMVIHDATVDRTTNGSGSVSAMTCAELIALDAGSWFASEFAGERIPTLEETLDLVRGKSKLILEAKEEGLEEETVRLVCERGMSEDAVIASFSEHVGFRLTELEPRMPFELIVHSAHKLGANESVQLADKAAGLDAAILAVNYEAITKALVESVSAANVRLLAWTVDDERSMESMIRLGIRMIVSNRLDLLLQVRERAA